MDIHCTPEDGTELQVPKSPAAPKDFPRRLVRCNPGTESPVQQLSVLTSWSGAWSNLFQRCADNAVWVCHFMCGNTMTATWGQRFQILQTGRSNKCSEPVTEFDGASKATRCDVESSSQGILLHARRSHNQ